jgi:hypothetical protein
MLSANELLVVAVESVPVVPLCMLYCEDIMDVFRVSLWSRGRAGCTLIGPLIGPRTPVLMLSAPALVLSDVLPPDCVLLGGDQDLLFELDRLLGESVEMTDFNNLRAFSRETASLDVIRSIERSRTSESAETDLFSESATAQIRILPGPTRRGRKSVRGRSKSSATLAGV